MKKNDGAPSQGDLLAGADHFISYLFPKVSIVIPTYNCSQSISLTLESILNQEYPDLEILIIDAQSTDRTLPIIKSFLDKRIRICSVIANHRYEMLNKGISIASGRYINFMFPGDFFIHPRVCKRIMEAALDKQFPHLAYGGCLIRDGKSEVKVLYRDLFLSILKTGRQPTSLQSCWFLNETFQLIGKFNTGYSLRGGFDLFCRFCLKGGLTSISIKEVVTDYDLRRVSREMIVKHFKETFQIIYKHFGLRTLLFWLLIQRDCYRYFKLSFRKFKAAFFGQRG